MKKRIILILLLAIILNMVVINYTAVVYAVDPEVKWLEKAYDDYYLYSFSEGVSIIVLENEYGYIDKMGKVLIPLKYDWAVRFSEGLAGISINNKYGFMDINGKEVIPFIYDWAYEFSEGLGVVGLADKYGYINKTGKEVIPLIYDYAEGFAEGLARVNLDGKWGYVDKIGNEVIPIIYDDALIFSEGLAPVTLQGKWGYINKNGKDIIPFNYNDAKPFSDGLAPVELNGKYGFINKKGEEVIPLKYNYTDIFSDGLALVELKGKMSFIDNQGKEVIPLKYDNVLPFSEGLALVELNEKYGYIDKTGKELVPIIYDYAHDFSEGLTIVRLGNKSGIMKNPLLNQKEKKPLQPKEKSISATPTPSKVLVNGKDISFDAYLIEDNNYFKLRDLANVVKGTKKQFEVTWDGSKNAINLVSNKKYTTVGGEMIKGNGSIKQPIINTSTIYKDNIKIDLKGYNIDGNNYFKLRDVAEAFGIGITWDGVTQTIGINTNEEKLLVYSYNNYKYLIWEQEYLFDKNKDLEVDLNNNGKLDYISVGMNTPNGQKVIISSNGVAINLLNYISDEMRKEIEYLYEEYDELKEGNMIQITLVDFDDDGDEEVVLAIGDGLVNLGVSIFKIDYNSKDLDVKEIGFFSGQQEMRIDKNKDIIIPFGGQGLSERHKYSNGKFD